MSARTLYDITSGTGFEPPHDDASGLLGHACSHDAMKPPIAPLLMSRASGSAPCGPPYCTSVGSWYSFTQPPLRGSGTHAVGRPFWSTASPSAPGYMPKYVSNDRFSCMITTT